jgi:hypothetical protein
MKLDTDNEYTACIESPAITVKRATELATAHRYLASWHKRGDNLAMAAWWQSIADRLTLEATND